jgi:hypothetical protein
MTRRSMRRMQIFAAIALAAVAAHPVVASPRQAQVAGAEMAPDSGVDTWLRRLVGRYRFEGVLQAVALGDCAGLPPGPPDPDHERVISLTEPYCRSIKGSGDCVAVGDGPGVQCVLSVKWVDMYRIVFPSGTGADEEVGVFTIPGGVPYLDPAMALLGFNASDSKPSYLLVDHKGLSEGGPGSIKGNRGTFDMPCVNAPTLMNEMNMKLVARCYRVLRIDAKPDAKVLHWSIDIDFDAGIGRGTYTRIEMTLRREAVETSD